MTDPRDQAQLALRALQKADQIAPLPNPLDSATIARQALARRYLIEAEDALGLMLGLTCTGVSEEAHTYNHSSSVTCPIHEWIDEDDCEEAETRLASMTR